MSNDIEITIGAKDEASQVAQKTSRSFADLGEKTDQMATKSSTAMGAFGALQSGIALTNQKAETHKATLAAENEQIADQVSKLQEQTDAQGKIPPAIQKQIDALNAKKAANDHETASLDASEHKYDSYVNGLQTAAFAADALSGVTDLATLAINSKIISVVKDTVATVAHTTVTGIAKVGTLAWSAAQWLLNAALTANPIGIVIVAIVALIAIIVLIATKTTWFQTIWKYVWDFMKGVGHWFANDFVGFFKHAFDWIINAVQSYYNFWIRIWGAIAAVPRGAINAIIRGWNALDFGIHIHIPSWVPFVGGMGFDINDIFPDIPYLAGGGIVKSRPGGTLAVLGEGSNDEAVIPLSGNGSSGGGGTGVEFSGNVDTAVAQLFMKLMRDGFITIRSQYVT